VEGHVNPANHYKIHYACTNERESSKQLNPPWNYVIWIQISPNGANCANHKRLKEKQPNDLSQKAGIHAGHLVVTISDLCTTSMVKHGVAVLLQGYVYGRIHPAAQSKATLPSTQFWKRLSNRKREAETTYQRNNEDEPNEPKEAHDIKQQEGTF
jgi:hypothetical protein